MKDERIKWRNNVFRRAGEVGAGKCDKQSCVHLNIKAFFSSSFIVHRNI